MDIDYYKLYDLRKTTRLNLIEWIKVNRMRCIAEKHTRLINKIEHCQLGVNFREADEYEFQRRLAKNERRLRG